MVDFTQQVCGSSGSAVNPRLDPLRLPFDLDQGRLVVSQPDRGHQLTVSADTARTEFLSTAEVAGPHSCLAFGLAEVATRPNTVEPGPPPRLAWVGLASAVIIACPVITDDSDEDHPEPVRVVIIDAGDPTSVSVYTSRGSHCGAPAVGPTLAPAHQVVSVPFQLVNLEVIAYDMPSCGQRFEDGDYSGSPGTGTLIACVHVAVPFDRGSCSSRHSSSPGAW